MRRVLVKQGAWISFVLLCKFFDPPLQFWLLLKGGKCGFLPLGAVLILYIYIYERVIRENLQFKQRVVWNETGGGGEVCH